VNNGELGELKVMEYDHQEDCATPDGKCARVRLRAMPEDAHTSTGQMCNGKPANNMNTNSKPQSIRRTLQFHLSLCALCFKPGHTANRKKEVVGGCAYTEVKVAAVSAWSTGHTANRKKEVFGGGACAEVKAAAVSAERRADSSPWRYTTKFLMFAAYMRCITSSQVWS
jgi:hypothetical protein